MRRLNWCVFRPCLLGLCVTAGTGLGGTRTGATAAELAEELKSVPFQIVYETFRDGNWELYQANADGTQTVNLTRTPDVNEMYPHVSPDGTKGRRDSLFVSSQTERYGLPSGTDKRANAGSL